MIRTISLLGFIFLTVTASATEDRYAIEKEVIELGKAVNAGNEAAARALFDVHADGAVAEEVDIILGKLVRSNPNLFLEALSKSWRANCERCLPGLMTNTGDELVERFSKQLKELEMRRKALQGVRKLALQPLRNKCLLALEAGIREVRRAIRIEAGEEK